MKPGISVSNLKTVHFQKEEIVENTKGSADLTHQPTLHSPILWVMLRFIFSKLPSIVFPTISIEVVILLFGRCQSLTVIASEFEMGILNLLVIYPDWNYVKFITPANYLN